MLLALMLILCVVAAIALVTVTWKEVRRAYRRRQLARELAAVSVSPVSPSPPFPDRRRPNLVRPEVQPLRPGEPWDPGAARVLAFRQELERDGKFVHEISIQRRLD